MPITVQVGHSQKKGLPNYGSVGASCNVQFEAPLDLLRGDLQRFHEEVHKAFAACQQAVLDQLAAEAPQATAPKQSGTAAAGRRAAATANVAVEDDSQCTAVTGGKPPSAEGAASSEVSEGGLPQPDADAAVRSQRDGNAERDAAVDGRSNAAERSSNGNGTTGNGMAGSGTAAGATTRRATARQMGYLRKLATGIRGLGLRRLEALAAARFGSPLAELSSGDASRLIAQLHAVQRGDFPLEALLCGDHA